MTHEPTLPELPEGADERIHGLLRGRLAATGRARARRHRAFLGAGIAVVLAGGTVAGVTVANDVLQDRSVYCYQAADTGATYQRAGNPDGGSPAQGRIAQDISYCGGVWQAGLLSNAAVTAGQPGGVPRLFACIRPDQVPAVFPATPGDTASGDALCARLRLAPAHD